MPDESSLRQYLTRWTIDRSEGDEFGMQRLSEVVCEYPRIDERRVGLPYRYGYVACIGGPGTGDMFHRAIGRFDHDTRRDADIPRRRPLRPCPNRCSSREIAISG